MICGSHAPPTRAGEQAPPPQAPPPMCPPRFCTAHDSSDKRVKGEPCFRDCQKCGIKMQSSYADFQLCPPCSEQEQKCMICGSHAPHSSTYIPAGPQGQPQGNQQGQNTARGKAGNLPPPPPPPPQSGRQSAPQSQIHSQAEADSMYMSRPPVPNTARMPSTPAQNGSHYMPAGNTPAQNGSHYMPTGNTPAQHGSHYMQNGNTSGQVFSTQLPAQWGQPQPHTPWEQNRGGMPGRPMPHQQFNNDPDDGLAGFLRFVAADIWKTCSNDNRQRDSPEKPFIRRGGA